MKNVEQYIIQKASIPGIQQGKNKTHCYRVSQEKADLTSSLYTSSIVVL